MSEQLDFETVLERRLRARAADASRPFDAVAVAGAAIARSPARWGFFHVRAMPWTRPMARVWLLLALLLALLAGMLTAGALLQHRVPWLAVARADGIYLANQDGSPVQRLTDASEFTQLSWSSDGALLLVQDVFPSVLHGQVSRMTVFRTDGSVAWTTDSRIVGFIFSPEAGWSHHGHRIAWWDGTGDGVDLVVTDVDSGRSVRPGKPSNWIWSAWSPGWSPDDSRIVAEVMWFPSESDTREVSMLMTVSTEGGEPVTLSQPRSGSGSMTAWSPDGQLIAATNLCLISLPNCVAPTDIALIDAGTGTLVDSIPAYGIGLEWSPDGKRLMWDGAEGVIVSSLPLSAGRAVDVMTGGFRASWTPDGALLIMKPNASSASDSSDPVRPDLWRVEADGSHPVLIAHDVTDAAVQPTP
jgi:Tol biopolymer transport system component